jgi:hypothetical protein
MRFGTIEARMPFRVAAFIAGIALIGFSIWFAAANWDELAWYKLVLLALLCGVMALWFIGIALIGGMGIVTRN